MVRGVGRLGHKLESMSKTFEQFDKVIFQIVAGKIQL